MAVDLVNRDFRTMNAIEEVVVKLKGIKNAFLK